MQKGIVVTIELLIIAWLGVIIANRYLAYFEKKPIVVVSQKEYVYGDGKAIEYDSLGCKVYHYQDSTENRWDFKGFWGKVDKKEITTS